jgi:hypothetical protein
MAQENGAIALAPDRIVNQPGLGGFDELVLIAPAVDSAFRRLRLGSGAIMAGLDAAGD